MNPDMLYAALQEDDPAADYLCMKTACRDQEGGRK